MNKLLNGSKCIFVKKAAPVLAALLLFVYIVALAFPVIEHHHECHGDHCPVCEVIELCEGLAVIFGAGLAVVFSVSAIVSSVAVIKNYFEGRATHRSPVAEKVRLND